MIEIRHIEEKDQRQLANIIRSIFEEYNAPLVNTVYDDPRTEHIFDTLTGHNAEYWVIVENDNVEENAKNFEAFDSQSLTINISGGSPNVIMEDEKGEKIIIISKKDLMKYLNKLYKENQGLKNFQNQIFNLSKSYDDINNNLAECIAGFQELCMNNEGDKINMQDVDEKLNELKKHIENSLETKQNEYNILLDKKDEDLSLLKSEFIEHEKEMKESGNDRLEEQRKIMELQIKKEELERQIAELEGNNGNNDGNNNEN